MWCLVCACVPHSPAAAAQTPQRPSGGPRPLPLHHIPSHGEAEAIVSPLPFPLTGAVPPCRSSSLFSLPVFSRPPHSLPPPNGCLPSHPPPSIPFPSPSRNALLLPSPSSLLPAALLRRPRCRSHRQSCRRSWRHNGQSASTSPLPTRHHRPPPPTRPHRHHHQPRHHRHHHQHVHHRHHHQHVIIVTTTNTSSSSPPLPSPWRSFWMANAVAAAAVANRSFSCLPLPSPSAAAA